MSRSRALLVCVLGLATILAVGSLARAQDSEIQNLTKKIDALEQRITTMERNITQQLQNLQRSIAQGGGADPREAEAEASFGQINRLVASGDLIKAKNEMSTFMSKYGTTQAARKASRLNAELSVIEKPAPTDWGIEKWFQGENAVDLKSDGCTLVVFWETWCPHCQREVPKLEALYQSMKDDGLQLIGLTKITKSATEEKVTDFIKERGVSYPVAKENGSASRHFNVSGIPAAAVVKGGKVVWRGHPARLSQDQLRKWL